MVIGMSVSGDKTQLQLLTVKQAAERLCCSAANVYTLIETGALAFVQVGHRKGYRIDLRDLDAFVHDRKFRLQSPVRTKVSSSLRLKHLRT
jgi:excisionase family DNA binding protein